MFNKTPKKILLSGVKPTGRPHIGNYFGAMKQFVDLLNSGEYECFLFIADYHALNLVQNPIEMRQYIHDLALDYLAIGLDPKKATLFKQSDISAHTELAWIFNTIVTMPYLMRAHAYKDAEAKNKEINVGTFDYPVLMAADILLYGADVVPVGQDQKQHVEYARDIAIKFNHVFGGPKDANNEPTKPVFKLPEPIIMENVATVPGIDGRKMSKSYGNTIPLFATREEITKTVMSIVTDSGAVDSSIPTNDDLFVTDKLGKPGCGIPVNVYNIHKLVRPESELKELYKQNRGKYKILKDTLIEDLEKIIAPMRERRTELAKNPKIVEKVLEGGAKYASKIADEKLLEAKKAVGVL